jgi:ferric-dicitrate binding protein FerR (iron transport regulator)
MKIPVRASALLAIALTIATSKVPSLNASQSEAWSVIVASNAYVTRQAATNALSIGDGVIVGDRLRTGDGGTLVLSRGEDLVTLSEASEIIVVDPQPENSTLIVQPAGNVQYHVTKEVRPHFEVDTPLMATVVKGTTFSVSAGGADSKVTVTEGRVVAKDRRSGASSSVGAGQSGSVSTNGHGVGVGAASSNNAASSAGASNPNDGNSAGASGGSSGGGKGKGGSANGNGGSGAGNGKGNGGKGSGEHGGGVSGGGKDKGKNK